MGAGKSLNRREKNSGEEKSRRRIKAPGDKVSKPSEQSWLLIGARKSLFFSAQSQSSNTTSRFVFSYTKYTYTTVARHKLTKGLLEQKSSKHSTKCSTLVPEAFFYTIFFIWKFATRSADRSAEPERKESLWSRSLRISLSCWLST